MVAAVLGIVRQAQGGGEIAAALRRGDRDADERFHRLVYESNPIDRWLYHIAAGKTRRWLAKFFWAPVTTTLAAVGLILADGASSRHLLGGISAMVVVALAIVTAVSVTIHLVTAVVRRLIFGSDDSRASDLEAGRRFAANPAAPPPVFKQWAVFVEEGSNLPLYFLGLVYLAVAGFVALYAGLDAVLVGAYSPQRLAYAPFSSVYLSVTTVSTVGFGDVHAARTLTEIAATWQIAMGPLLLSWLLAVFLTPGTRTAGATVDQESQSSRPNRP
jgi:hypothetical protein